MACVGDNIEAVFFAPADGKYINCIFEERRWRRSIEDFDTLEGYAFEGCRIRTGWEMKGCVMKDSFVGHHTRSKDCRISNCWMVSGEIERCGILQSNIEDLATMKDSWVELCMIDRKFVSYGSNCFVKCGIEFDVNEEEYCDGRLIKDPFPRFLENPLIKEARLKDCLVRYIKTFSNRPISIVAEQKIETQNWDPNLTVSAFFNQKLLSREAPQ
jgi:hypothetical protein